MSHISTGVEYAIHCLLLISEPESGVAEARVRELAELQGVPFEYLAKIFTKLHKAGLVVATEGVKGGVRLARPAAQISVLDVVRAVDGDKELFDCREIRSRCALFEGEAPKWAVSGVCSVHAVMLEAQQQMRKVLAKRSIADLAGEVASKVPRKFGENVVHWLASRAESRQG